MRMREVKANICLRFHIRLHERVVALLFAVILLPQIAYATYYVHLKDGRLSVFPSTSISGVVEQDDSISFIALDGVEYSYLRSEIESIDEQLNKTMPKFLTYKFDNKHNYQITVDVEGFIGIDYIHIDVGAIGKRLTPSFTLSDSLAHVFVDGVEQQSGVTRMRFDEPKNYLVGYDGDQVLMPVGDGSYAMRPYGKEYKLNIYFLTDYCPVPRIDINTLDGVNISSKEYYVDAEIIIDGGGIYPSMTDSVKIKGRGNTSWSSDPLAKNPYRLKFNKKVKPLGLTKGKKWVLLANNQYGSMLTNAIGMKAASLIGTVAANHIIPVDLYVNGVYKGNYNLTEKVGLAGNSVDLANEDMAALLELDTYYDELEGQKFMSDPQNIPVNVKYPEFGEDSTAVSLENISARFNAFVRAVNNEEDIADHVNIDALARYLMLNELICNKEIFHPKSTYCYYENVLEDSSKLIFGPVWDLDWAFGYNTMPSSYFEYKIEYDYFNTNSSAGQYEFVRKLGNNEKVSQRMYELWKDFIGDGLDELCEFCLDYYYYAKPSLEKSVTAFPDSISYSTQSTRAVRWLRKRANYIYNRICEEHWLLGDVNGDGIMSVLDITVLIDYLLNEQNDATMQLHGDINKDGFVNIKDITTLIDMLLTGT